MTQPDKPQEPLMFAGQTWTPDELRDLFACYDDMLTTGAGVYCTHTDGSVSRIDPAQFRTAPKEPVT